MNDVKHLCFVQEYVSRSIEVSARRKRFSLVVFLLRIETGDVHVDRLDYSA